MRNFLTMSLLLSVVFLFTQCEKDDDKKDEDDGPEEISVSDYTYYFPGKWKDGYATRYYCDDNTWYADFDNGNTASGTWELDEDELTVNYSSGQEYVYFIDQMFEDEFTMIDQGSDKEYTAELMSSDGCYFLDVDEYEDNIPGKWYREYNDSYFEYYLCDDGTFYYQFNGEDNHLGPYSWYYDNGELVLEFSFSDWELNILQMSSDEIYAEDDNSEEKFTLVSSDGCYVPPMGSAVFYITEDCGCGHIDVQIDGENVGTIDSYISSGEVDCGDSGALTVDLSPGDYSVYAECDGYYWEFELTISDNDCSQEELMCSKKIAK
ncbi:MAG: hypothetical protein K9I47_07820 [Bacteroidales bacterium]|nr:hypothetical protein [Bacteroidales bacterium]